jgi:hypothetical protein
MFQVFARFNLQISGMLLHETPYNWDFKRTFLQSHAAPHAFLHLREIYFNSISGAASCIVGIGA